MQRHDNMASWALKLVSGLCWGSWSSGVGRPTFPEALSQQGHARQTLLDVLKALSQPHTSVFSSWFSFLLAKGKAERQGGKGAVEPSPGSYKGLCCQAARGSRATVIFLPLQPVLSWPLLLPYQSHSSFEQSWGATDWGLGSSTGESTQPKSTT